MNLKPCSVFYSGIMATGKSTVMQSLATAIDNVIDLDRDEINKGNLYVAPTFEDGLLPFNQYVFSNHILSNHARNVETPFGPMIQIDPHNSFYRRHIRDQSYMIQLKLARLNLQSGKVPLLGGVSTRQIQDGTLRKMIDHIDLKEFPIHLIHFYADEEIIYQRALERMDSDPSSKTRVNLIPSTIRDGSPLASRRAFHEFVTREQPIIPNRLSEYTHLAIDTTNQSIESCRDLCIKYIRHRNS